MHHTLALRRAPAARDGLPVLPPAHIDSSGLRCRAQSAGGSDLLILTVADQVETPAPCLRVAKSPGAPIERLKAHTRTDARQIRNPCLRGVADQEGGAPPMRRRSQSSVKVRNVLMMAQQIGKHAWRVLIAVGGVPTSRLKARKEASFQRIRNQCPSGVAGQEAGASAVFLCSQSSLRARGDPIELTVTQPIWKLTRRIRMAAGGEPIERSNVRKQAGWCRIANPSLT